MPGNAGGGLTVPKATTFSGGRPPSAASTPSSSASKPATTNAHSTVFSCAWRPCTTGSAAAAAVVSPPAPSLSARPWPLWLPETSRDRHRARTWGLPFFSIPAQCSSTVADTLSAVFSSKPPSQASGRAAVAISLSLSLSLSLCLLFSRPGLGRLPRAGWLGGPGGPPPCPPPCPDAAQGGGQGQI